MRIYLIRHAPAIKPNGVLYGVTDYEADLSNVKAIDRLAASIPANAPCFSSPLKRAKCTAEAVMRAKGKQDQLRIDARLSEQNYGLLETLALTQVLQENPNASRWGRAIDRCDFLPPDGESYLGLIDRVSAFAVEANSRFSELVAFTHRGVIQAFLHIAGQDLTEEMWRRDIAHLSMTVIEFSGLKHAGIH